MLISNAGYLFDFTKDKDVSIRQLIGPAATGDERDRQMLVNGEDVSYTYDRIVLLRKLRDLWAETKYSPTFSITHADLADKVGRTTARVARHINDLADARLLLFTPPDGEAPNNQHYAVSSEARVPKKDVAQTAADYVREYIFATQTGIHLPGAIGFCL